MHLEVAVILAGAWAVECRVRQDADHFSAAEEMCPQRAARIDLFGPAAQLDRALDGWRGAHVEHFEDDAARCRAYAGDLLKRSVRAAQLGQWVLQRQHRTGRALVAEHSLW